MASSSWQLGADSHVEINKAYINTVCTRYYFPEISTNWWQLTELMTINNRLLVYMIQPSIYREINIPIKIHV